MKKLNLFQENAVNKVDLQSVKGGAADPGVTTNTSEATCRLKWANGSDEEVADTSQDGDWLDTPGCEE